MNSSDKYKHDHLSRMEMSVNYEKNSRLVSADNEIVVIENEKGETKRLIDLMSSYGAVNFGHTNRNINPFDNLEADLVTFFLPKEADIYSDWLCRKINRPDGKVLFQVGGTAGVSAAISLAQQNRPGKIVSIVNGFHGLAIDALSLTTISKKSVIQETPIRKSLSNQFISIKEGDEIEDWSDISCIIFEPVQGASGLIPLNQEWIKSICNIASKEGVITISDEIQCGYFRCGALSYTESIGLSTDIIIFGKSLTNGLFPFSAVVYNKRLELEKMKDLVVFGHTFQSSAIGFYCAHQVSRYIDSVDIDEMIISINNKLRVFSDSLFDLGLVINVHLMGPSLSMEYIGGSADSISRECFNHGVMLATGGKNDCRFRITPPITIPLDSLDKGLSILKNRIENHRIIKE